MSVRRKLIGIVLLSVAAVNACSQEAMVPTHLAQINLAPARYDDLKSKLDAAMKDSGLSRYGAAPGLNELQGREVLYIEYRLQPSDKWAFLTATDVVKAGTVEVRVYSTVLTEQGRPTAMSRLDAVLAEFSSALRAHTAEQPSKKTN
jgi:hypothetical protein